jgi:hypothetical protein
LLKHTFTSLYFHCLPDLSNNAPEKFQFSIILKACFFHLTDFQLKEVVCSLGFQIEGLATLHLKGLMKTTTVSGDKTTLEAMGTPVQIISTTSFREMLLQLVPEVL